MGSYIVCASTVKSWDYLKFVWNSPLTIIKDLLYHDKRANSTKKSQHLSGIHNELFIWWGTLRGCRLRERKTVCVCHSSFVPHSGNAIFLHFFSYVIM